MAFFNWSKLDNQICEYVTGAADPHVQVRRLEYQDGAKICFLTRWDDGKASNPATCRLSVPLNVRTRFEIVCGFAPTVPLVIYSHASFVLLRGIAMRKYNNFYGLQQYQFDVIIYTVSYATRAEAGLAIVEYIEMFYNSEQSHQALGYQTPNEFEAKYFGNLS